VDLEKEARRGTSKRESWVVLQAILVLTSSYPFSATCVIRTVFCRRHLSGDPRVQARKTLLAGQDGKSSFENASRFSDHAYEGPRGEARVGLRAVIPGCCGSHLAWQGAGLSVVHMAVVGDGWVLDVENVEVIAEGTTIIMHDRVGISFQPST